METNNMKRSCVTAISGLLLLTLIIAVIPATCADNPPGNLYSVSGFVTLNGQIAPADVDVKIILSIPNRTDQFNLSTADGRYTVDFLALQGETASFKVHVYNQDVIPTDNQSFYINHLSPYWYFFNLSVNATPLPPEPPGGDTGGNTGGGNNPPTADAGGPYFGTPNSEIEFDGAASNDTDGTIVQYDWKFFNTDTWHNNLGETPTHTYTEPGTYQVTLRVTDDDGSKDENATTAEISQPNNPPTTPIISGPTDGDHNMSYEFTFVSTDADNDTLQYMIDWDDGTTTTTEFTTSGIAVTQTHSWIPGRYTLTAKASDNQTESATADHTVYIDAEQVGDIGYLTDTNGDGIYDMFSSDTTDKTSIPEHQTDGTYFIDNDADGDWDYIYDPQTKTITPYPNKGEGTPQSDTTLQVLGGILGIIAVLFIILLLLIRRKKNKPTPPAQEMDTTPNKSTTKNPRKPAK